MSALDHDVDHEVLAAAALDPEDMVHGYADRPALLRALADGTPLLALCGRYHGPPRDAEFRRTRPVCAICAELVDMIHRARDLCGGER